MYFFFMITSTTCLGSYNVYKPKNLLVYSKEKKNLTE